MARLLHIDASPREARSKSRPVADAFLSALEGHEVETLDVWDEELPPLGGAMIEGRYSLIMGEPVDANLSARWDAVRAHAERFLSFDAVLLSVPMWNFGLPYRLKHYIDLITQPGMAFTNDAAGNVVGGASHMRAVIIAASAMPFGKDEALSALDFQVRYLEAWMDFIGIERRDIIRVSPTFGAAEDIARTVKNAAADAAALAASF